MSLEKASFPFQVKDVIDADDYEEQVINARPELKEFFLKLEQQAKEITEKKFTEDILREAAELIRGREDSYEIDAYASFKREPGQRSYHS